MLTEKEKKLLAKAEENLAMPRWKFVLLYGVISWGILTALFVTLISSFLFKQRSVNEVLKKDLWINLGTFMIGGIFFGLLVRWLSKKQVQKLREKDLQS